MNFSCIFCLRQNDIPIFFKKRKHHHAFTPVLSSFCTICLMYYFDQRCAKLLLILFLFMFSWKWQYKSATIIFSCTFAKRYFSKIDDSIAPSTRSVKIIAISSLRHELFLYMLLPSLSSACWINPKWVAPFSDTLHKARVHMNLHVTDIFLGK